jgi:hypothetical protein
MAEIVITIEQDGNLTFLDTESSQMFKELGPAVTRRASHVLPAKFLARQAFKLIRLVVRDDSAGAARCRTWRGPWLVDTTPTAGVVLAGRWMNRQDAIDAEIAFLNSWFLEGTCQHTTA